MLTELEKQFLIAVLKELRFTPEAADNAVFTRDLIKKLSTSVEEVKEETTSK